MDISPPLRSGPKHASHSFLNVNAHEHFPLTGSPNTPFYGRNVLVVSSDGYNHVVLMSETIIGWIQPVPPRTRHPNLDPRVGCVGATNVFSFRVINISTDVSSRQQQRAAQGEQ